MPENKKPRLRIRKLSMENFRGIDHLELEFIDHHNEALDLVVFAGGNGVGKTSVLEMLLLILGQKEVWFGKDSLEDQVRFGTHDFILSVEIDRPNGEFMPTRLRVGREELLFSVTPVSLIGGGIAKEPSNEFWRQIFSFTRLQVEYFPANRYTDNKGRPDNDTLKPNPNQDRLSDLKEKLRNTYYRMLRSGQKTNDSFEKLQKMWRLFHGNEQELDVIPVDNNPGSGDEVVIRDPKPIPSDITSLAQARELAPTRDDIPKMVPLDRLSSGQMALLSFAGPLVFRDKPVDFVLIDEPEQHLHVQWQRFLLPALRELAPQAQFFVATHSEEILESVLSYERFILVESNDPRALPTAQEIAQ
jgi:energy-coupling factor transporter ATP-binding protein EcfA2